MAQRRGCEDPTDAAGPLYRFLDGVPPADSPACASAFLKGFGEAAQFQASGDEASAVRTRIS